MSKQDESLSNRWKTFVHSVRSSMQASKEVNHDLIDAQSTLAGASNDSSKSSVSNHKLEKPNRLVDFFCIVGPDTKNSVKNKKEEQSPTTLTPTVLDCHPKSRDDVEFPKHVHSFCFPNGCNESLDKKSPILWTMVLTSSTGHRLYATVLTIWECKPPQSPDKKRPTKKPRQVTVYWPKCLMVLSHYSYFHGFRVFLQQLYNRATRNEGSPLPLERYIAHFCRDVPLPSLDTRVEYHSVPLEQNAIVSLRPLFSVLSLSNILVLWGMLLQEGRIVLRSQYRSLLTPVAEALLSLLAPFEWQGLYIPVLLSQMQLVLLDAPVPYLVGINGDVPDKQVPAGVVLCDLDEDVVHMGQSHDGEPQWLPAIPNIIRLKVEVEDLVDHLYLVPSSGVKGLITNGANRKLLDNSAREPYSQMTKFANKNSKRQFILNSAEKNSFVCTDNELHDGPQLTRQPSPTKETTDNSQENYNFATSFRRSTRAFQAHTDRLLAFAGQTYATTNPFVTGDAPVAKEVSVCFYGFQKDDETWSHAVRQAFWDFFLSLFASYKTHVGADGEVDSERFVKSMLSLPKTSKQFLTAMLETQLFEGFLVATRSNEPNGMAWLFNKHISFQKENDTLFKSSARKRKKAPPALWSRDKIERVITPAGPCSYGVRSGSPYRYPNGFPSKLKQDELLHSGSENLWSYQCQDVLFCSASLCWPTSP